LHSRRSRPLRHGAQRLISQRKIEMVLGQASTGRAADLHGFEALFQIFPASS